MKIRNIQLKSIEARKYIGQNERPKQVRIDHNSNFTNITNIENERATIEFQYTASYGPVGMIKLEGLLIFETNEVKKIVKDWKEKRKMPDQIASQLHTAIMHSCVPQAVGIAKDLGLPPPIPLPQVRLGQGQSSKKINFGPEVA